MIVHEYGHRSTIRAASTYFYEKIFKILSSGLTFKDRVNRTTFSVYSQLKIKTMSLLSFEGSFLPESI